MKEPGYNHEHLKPNKPYYVKLVNASNLWMN